MTNPDTAALVDRLRKKDDRVLVAEANADELEAAQAIEALLAENKRLREALDGFISVATAQMSYDDWPEMVECVENALKAMNGGDAL